MGLSSLDTRARTERVLLVDDRADNLLALEATLDPLGFSLCKALSGHEALHLLLEDEVDLIILDVQMPDMDGFETASLIKSRVSTRNIPIIFLTAINVDFDHQIRGYDVGAIDYICKPFDPFFLRAKVRALVQLSKDMRALAGEISFYREQLATTDLTPQPSFSEVADPRSQELISLVRILECDIEAESAGPSRARTAIRAAFEDKQIAVFDDVLLVASELLTNCFVHARTTAQIRVDLGSSLIRIEVSDASDHQPKRRVSALYDQGGRGLEVVRLVVQRCGWTTTDDGKTVWAEFDLAKNTKT